MLLQTDPMPDARSYRDAGWYDSRLMTDEESR
jgi:hypothetical protein